jgi:hypothetical protein
MTAYAIGDERVALAIGLRVHLVAAPAGSLRAATVLGPLPGEVLDLAWLGSRLIALSADGALTVWDAADLDRPDRLSALNVSARVTALAARGRSVYVAEGGDAIRAFDMGEDGALRSVGTVPLPYAVTDLWVTDDRLYARGQVEAANSGAPDLGMVLYDRTGAGAPVLLGSARPGDHVPKDSRYVVGIDRVYALVGDRLRTVGFADPAQLAVSETALPFAGSAWPVAADGNRLALAVVPTTGPAETVIVDLADPAAPRIAERVAAVGVNRLAGDTVWRVGDAELARDRILGGRLETAGMLGLPGGTGTLLRLGPGSLLKVAEAVQATWFDVRDPTRPIAHPLALSAWPWGAPLAADGPLVVARESRDTNRAKVVILNVARPRSPVALGTLQLMSEPEQPLLPMAFSGSVLAVSTRGEQGDARIAAYGLQDMAAPRPLGDVSAEQPGLEPGEPVYITAMGIADELLLATTRIGFGNHPPALRGELLVYRLNAAGPPALAGRLALPQPGWDVAVDGDRVFVVTGPTATRLEGERDIPAAPSRLHVVDASRPTAPKELHQLVIGDHPRTVLAGAGGLVLGYVGPVRLELRQIPGGGLSSARPLALPSLTLAWLWYWEGGGSRPCSQWDDGPMWCDVPGAALEVVSDGESVWALDRLGGLWGWPTDGR